jgi:hypothetical protein
MQEQWGLPHAAAPRIDLTISIAVVVPISVHSHLKRPFESERNDSVSRDVNVPTTNTATIDRSHNRPDDAPVFFRLETVRFRRHFVASPIDDH